MDAWFETWVIVLWIITLVIWMCKSPYKSEWKQTGAIKVKIEKDKDDKKGENE